MQKAAAAKRLGVAAGALAGAAVSTTQPCEARGVPENETLLRVETESECAGNALSSPIDTKQISISSVTSAAPREPTEITSPIAEEAIAESRELISLTLKDIGNSWISIDATTERLLSMGAELASQPAVQQAYLEISREQGHAMMGPSASSAQSVQSLSSLSPTESMMNVTEHEVNQMFLFRHASTLQAAARRMLARKNVAVLRGGRFHPTADALLRDLPKAARVACRASVELSEGGAPSVKLQLRIFHVAKSLPRPSIEYKQGLEAEGERRESCGRGRHVGSHEQAMVSAVAIVVGLLAVVIARNPAAARAAAIGAAAAVTAICAKARMVPAHAR